LAVELQWGREAERRMRLAREALTVARESRDPDALSRVLSFSWALIDGSKPFSAEMAASFDEAESVAREADSPAALANALRGKAYLAACHGDGAAFAAHLESAARVGEGLRRPALNWTMRNDAAALAVFTGDLGRAEQLATEALDLARVASIADDASIGVFGSVLYLIRMAQGRVGELVPLLEGRVEAAPDVAVWRVALTAALTESDRVDEARVHYLWLAADGCAKVPADVEFAVTVCGLARTAYRVRPSNAIMRDVYERLAPFAGLFNWTGSTVNDANDFGLAMTAAALGRPDDADHHFADAVDLCDRSGARPFVARYHLGWATVLADRGDTSHAREQADITIALGSELGMTGAHGVVPRAQALLDTL
jgi:hypothetical protein